MIIDITSGINTSLF